MLLVALQDLPGLLTEHLSLSAGLAQRLEGNLALAVFGLVLIVVMLAAPGGLQGGVRALTARLRGAVRRRPATPRPPDR
ncbi:hypothetical protein MCBG_00455 [Micromonospora sp. M42]|nr:hypothetical protein MCBG_00455 [Micromonospora sp. M42]